MTKKKVLLLLTDLENRKFFGGIQMYNHSLLNSLRNLNYNCNFFTLNDYNQNGCSQSKSKFIFRFLKQILLFKPDLVICGHINFAFLCQRACKPLGIPYYVICHGIDALNMSRSKITALQKAEKLIAVSKYTQKNVQQQTHNNNFFLLPPCVDNNKFKIVPRSQNLTQKWNLHKKDKIILTICRLSKKEMYKGYDIIINVLPQVLESVKNVKYILGGTGDDLTRVKNLVSQKNLHDNVIITGFIPDDEIVDYYNLCDIFAMPSQKEGFGIVFTEASCCGRPTLAGNKDGSSDAVLEGKTGILVNPDDPQQIANSLITFLNNNADPKFYDREYLRNQTVEAYSYENFKKRVENVMQA
ncbi:glycosyltransferase family 4 protein [Candidatus Uabimicrobium sp. HlEnr_7]|uniref:glycosyltransferase family 4 protein n=1 Tax=Candidatus Uabimicrobium helgolandensis TaxID=3095367 RepID=UPI00355844AD